MHIPYKHSENIKLNQYLKNPQPQQIDARQVALIIVPEKPGKAAWDMLAYADVLKPRYQHLQRQPGDHACLSTDLPNKRGTRVLLQAMDAEASTFECLTIARELAAAAGTQNPASLLLHIAGFPQATAAGLLEAMTAALLASVCQMPSFKSDADKPAALKQIDIYGLKETVDLAPVQAEIAGNHLARWLAALPPNELTPTLYRKFIRQLAAKEGWTMKFLGSKALAREQAGAFLAVSQGSPVDDAGIVHLSYRPKKRGGRKLALVGKGICFDTGGVNVKPARYMNGMHEDMQGSAVALGTLLALSHLDYDHPVDCWLALAENHIGSRAYKPNDVVIASNGTSIEVKHTDAEGRMVLADTLALASKGKPYLMIDYATLTGACIYSLSSRYSGVFSNRDALHGPLTEAGRNSGERVWPFPLDKDFDESLKSTVADTLQCTLEGDADHILAARFLKRFVDKKT
ncbi:MAG: leucyl aminopeptidase family protein, partial [Gammaproteobacteria bacterium]|nr:leucyl aminopeptidase family protein [Gammaproteobacteria bacterium]